ncbi:MAG: hypothetical protein AAB424_00710 [Patescibacteria group bacterium]
MLICILGDTHPNEQSDRLAEELAVQLCTKVSSDSRRGKPFHQLMVTASPTGTAEAVRRGADRCLVKRVDTHSLGPPHPDVVRNRNQSNGYYTLQYTDPLERLHHLEATPVLVFLALNRRSVGLLLNTLYALGQELQEVQGLRTVPRKILIWADALAVPGSTNQWSLDTLQHYLGHTVSEEDQRKIIIFEKAGQVVEHVDYFSAQIQQTFGSKDVMEQSR